MLVNAALAKGHAHSWLRMLRRIGLARSLNQMRLKSKSWSRKLAIGSARTAQDQTSPFGAIWAEAHPA
jgi:hypothetical protein